jgi:hypothetical protein
MSGVTLQDAERSFAAALQNLRQSHLAAFELWLRGALAKGATGSDAVAGQIAASRRKLAEAFVTGRAAAIAETLTPGAGARIQQRLAEFATLGDLPTLAEAGAPKDPDRWSGALRTALGAALGAAVALLVLASVPTRGPRALPPTVAAQEASQAKPHPPTNAEHAADPAPGQQPAPAPPNAAAKPDAAPAAKPRHPTPPARNGARSGLLAAIIGAFGAAIGAFATAMPARRRDAAALRSPLGGIAIGALAIGAAGLAGRWLTGPAPWWSALLAVAAALAVWLVRELWPGKASDASASEQPAVTALERQLRADCAVWSALAAGLVLGGEGGEGPAKELDHVRAIVLTHRDRGVAGEEILRVIEQELRLPIGPREAVAAGDPPAWADFNWSPQRAGEFDTFGIVEPGDLVRVKIAPQTVVENGAARVIQKGVVVRKS